MSAFVDFHTHHSVNNATYIFSHSLGEGFAVPSEPHSAGIHPWAVDKVDTQSALATLRSADIIAVGEIGLDYVCTSNREKQRQLFENQLVIACSRHLPVVIHCVRAQDDTMSILAQYNPKAVVFHGYIGSVHQLIKLIEQGYYVSFGKSSLQSPKTIEAMRHTPLDKMFLESDAATDLSIGEIYAQASDILGINIEILKDQLYKNYKTIFE